MRNLWQDVQAHKLAAMAFLVYWIATLVVVTLTRDGDLPMPVFLLLLTVPLLAGILVRRWRSAVPGRTVRWAEKAKGGMLAGFLCAAMTNLVMKGGVLDEVQGYLRGWAHYGQWDGVAAFFIVYGVLGLILGLAGAALASIMERFRHRLSPS